MKLPTLNRADYDYMDNFNIACYMWEFIRRNSKYHKYIEELESLPKDKPLVVSANPSGKDFACVLDPSLKSITVSLLDEFGIQGSAAYKGELSDDNFVIFEADCTSSGQMGQIC